MKQGFTLIEIMIGMVIAGLLSAGLFTTIRQVGKEQQTIGDITSTYGRLAIFQQQIERDLMGAFVPTQYDLLPTQTDRKETQKKPLEKIFYGESKGKGGRLDYMTFITNNPLEIYFGVKDVKLKPRVARVVYRLTPDPRKKIAYLLQRQEGTAELAFEKYSLDGQGEYRAFTLIDGIQDITVKFITIEEKEDKEAKKISYNYKATPSWDSKPKENPDAAKAVSQKGQPQQRPWPRLPNQVEIALSLLDSTYENYKTFTVTIPIASKYGQFEIPEKKKNEEGKPEAKKPEEKQ